MKWRGFTLIEMVITVAIVGLLATAVFPLAELGVRRAKEQELRIALRTIRDAIDEYKDHADAGRIERTVGDTGYPQNFDVLVDGVTDIRSADGRKIYFLRKLPRDPFYPDKTVPAANTWQQRSYESPPDNPQPGDDIYDVHSMSAETALDGTAYATW